MFIIIMLTHGRLIPNLEMPNLRLLRKWIPSVNINVLFLNSRRSNKPRHKINDTLLYTLLFISSLNSISINEIIFIFLHFIIPNIIWDRIVFYFSYNDFTWIPVFHGADGIRPLQPWGQTEFKVLVVICQYTWGHWLPKTDCHSYSWRLVPTA